MSYIMHPLGIVNCRIKNRKDFYIINYIQDSVIIKALFIL